MAAHRGWCAILRQLRRMCADARSEVRTCAMHTLTNLLTSHGATLGGATWDFALWHALLPLMGELTAAAAAANATAPVAQTLGKEGGRPVLMLLHHSRDTASKQWDETWVLALTAFARLFRSFLPLLQPRPAFDAAWRSSRSTAASIACTSGSCSAGSAAADSMAAASVPSWLLAARKMLPLAA